MSRHTNIQNIQRMQHKLLMLGKNLKKCTFLAHVSQPFPTRYTRQIIYCWQLANYTNLLSSIVTVVGRELCRLMVYLLFSQTVGSGSIPNCGQLLATFFVTF